MQIESISFRSKPKSRKLHCNDGDLMAENWGESEPIRKKQSHQARESPF